MITIKILNAPEVVRNRKGRLLAKLGAIFVNLEREVEKEVVDQITDVFRENGIDACIQIVDDLPTKT